jgi:hypothetical protein
MNERRTKAEKIKTRKESTMSSTIRSRVVGQQQSSAGMSLSTQVPGYRSTQGTNTISK